MQKRETQHADMREYSAAHVPYPSDTGCTRTSTLLCPTLNSCLPGFGAFSHSVVVSALPFRAQANVEAARMPSRRATMREPSKNVSPIVAVTLTGVPALGDG